MEDDLVMNRLPLPKYYDGTQWNTIIKPTRKSIPKYLHQDLPQLKHIYIKEKFKQIGKFNCPQIDFFQKMIKTKKTPASQKKQKLAKKNKQISYGQMKQQLQYALLTTDINSNIIDGLLNNVRKAETRRGKSTNQMPKLKQKKKNSLTHRQTGKYFNNTVDLVFRQRKKQYLNSLKKGQQFDISQAQEKINEIKLLKFQN